MRRTFVTLLNALSIATLAADFSGASDATATSSPVGRPLETWNGITAHTYGGACSDVYATSGTDVHYGPPGVHTDTCGFQCVELAVRYFHFNEGVPADQWHVGAAVEMCGSHPDGVVQTNNPQVGDLMIYKANDRFYGTGPSGHVAVIRALKADGSLDVFNQRWRNESTAFTNGILRSHAACFLHSTHSSGEGEGGGSGKGEGGSSNPCSRVPASANGNYCGSSNESGFRGGLPTALYTCSAGTVSHTSTCPLGCYVARVGQNDGCYSDPCIHVPSADNGRYCGSSRQSGFAGGSPDLLYDCQKGKTGSTHACKLGCFVAPAGQLDRCK
jgi:hypothetical protein